MAPLFRVPIYDNPKEIVGCDVLERDRVAIALENETAFFLCKKRNFRETKFLCVSFNFSYVPKK